MKRIVSFVILLAVFIVILTFPAVETPVTASHPVPVWSILCYLAVVGAAGAAGFLLRRGDEIEEVPELEEEPELA